jgi:hypothetical protein
LSNCTDDSEGWYARNGKLDALRLRCPTSFLQTATTITVGWFGDRTCKHNNEWYTQLPKWLIAIVHIAIVHIHVSYKCGRGLHNTTWGSRRLDSPVLNHYPSILHALKENHGDLTTTNFRIYNVVLLYWSHRSMINNVLPLEI